MLLFWIFAFAILLPPPFGDHSLWEKDMRNTVLFLVMASLYALSSHMDYLDEEMLEAHASDIRAEMDCRAMPADCPANQTERLTLSSR